MYANDTTLYANIKNVYKMDKHSMNVKIAKGKQMSILLIYIISINIYLLR